MAVPFHVISTGSKGNAVVVNGCVLIDCGVSFKAIKPYVSSLKLVLLTHIHSDHFNSRTLRLLAERRPTLRFGCCRWLAADLVSAGVPKNNIDVLDADVMYGYGICNVIPVLLVHDVPNCGYKLHFPIGKVFYATDTNNLNGIKAKHYDLYMVEANYEDDVIQEKIAAKTISIQEHFDCLPNGGQHSDLGVAAGWPLIWCPQAFRKTTSMSWTLT